jgi:tetratricopeptide (TPR) repeat protein
MVYFAKNAQLPDAKLFSVKALEKPDSPLRSPVYIVKIGFAKKEPLQVEVNVDGPIWSAAVYSNLTAALANEAGLNPSLQSPSEDTALLKRLTDGLATTVEQENEKLSAALQSDFSNPLLHEQAAVLLGAFSLRETSGMFYDIRASLCRATAHLALAQYLNGSKTFGVNGRVAECLMLTLVNDEAAAIKKLGAMDLSDETLKIWDRTLRAFNTGDYRPLAATTDRSTIEDIALFSAYSGSINNDVAWQKLGWRATTLPDFARISEAGHFTVAVGNGLQQTALDFEIKEIKSVYQSSQHHELTDEDLVSALNRLPDFCFAPGAGGAPKVHVIGWGLWALMLQHQLCQALTTDFSVLWSMQGLPEEANSFNEFADKTFSGLRLYPFVERFTDTEIKRYHKSVDDGFKVTVETPQLTPAMCWNYICWSVNFAPHYKPVPNPHVNEWHKHNPPPGTAYDLGARLNHPSLTDNQKRMDQVLEEAPYDLAVLRHFVDRKYNKIPTFEQAKSLFGPLLDYSVPAMRIVAGALKAEPERYEETMEKAAKLDPTLYEELGDFAWGRNDTNKAISYYDTGADKDPDLVRESHRARRRVAYYLKKGETEKARTIADAAADVYSQPGLAAKADFHESIGELETAMQWFAKIKERYNNSDELVEFCARHFKPTGKADFDKEVRQHLKEWEKKTQKVSLADFTSPPADGALVITESDLLKGAGLKKGDIVVAVDGIRVHNMWQYRVDGAINPDPQMTFIVWQDGHYREAKASLPDHKFGVLFNDYKSQ